MLKKFVVFSMPCSKNSKTRPKPPNGDTQRHHVYRRLSLGGVRGRSFGESKCPCLHEQRKSEESGKDRNQRPKVSLPTSIRSGKKTRSAKKEEREKRTLKEELLCEEDDVPY